MSKILRLREWLSVSETARHLSQILSEDLGESDIYRLALDGHLTLSVNFVNRTYAKKQEIVPVADCKTVLNLDGDGHIILGDYWTEDEYMVSTGMTTEISGIFDLPLRLSERLDIEKRYQKLTGGPDISWVNLDGTLVRDSSGTYWKIQTIEHTECSDGSKIKKDRMIFPASELPSDCTLVVRTSALTALQDLLTDKPLENQTSQRERTTFLNIIGALLEFINSKESGIISEILEKHPDKPGLKMRTLQEKFAEAKRSLQSY